MRIVSGWCLLLWHKPMLKLRVSASISTRHTLNSRSQNIRNLATASTLNLARMDWPERCFHRCSINGMKSLERTSYLLVVKWKTDPEIAESHDVEDEPVISEPMRLVLLSPQYPDSHAVLRTFIAPFGEGNSVGELVEVENMIKDAVEESDADTRSLKYAEIEQYIIDQALALPLRIDEYRFEFRVQPWVNGLQFPMYGGSAFYSVRMESSTNPQIEKTQRSEIQVQSNSPNTASEGSGVLSAVDPRRGVTGDVLFVDAVDCGIPDPAIDDASELRSSTDFVLVSEIHAGLMEIAPSTNDIVPALVESYSLGENGVTYVFNLRKDLKFSDGSPLTAVDVKWSWERALRESTTTSRANDVFGSILRGSRC